MWPTGYVSRWRDAGEIVAGPSTLARTTLRSVIAQIASVIRCAGIVYVVVQVLIWHSFYTAAPWRLTAPAVAVAWATAVTARLRRRAPSLALVGADCAGYLALALAAAECVPPGVRDDPYSWVVIGMSSQIMVPAWYAPGDLALLLTFSSPLAYWAGALLWPVASVRTLLGATMMLIIVGLLHTLGRRALYRRAAVADAALDQADRTASEQYVILTRTVERREHERLLHDTVLNTLTALARGGGDNMAEVMNRCRADVALIEDALGGPDGAAAATGTGRLYGDLPGELRAVAAGLRARGLTVHLDLAAGQAVAVPARVAAAIAKATREALSNVAAHAGTKEAWVTVRPAEPAQIACRLVVTVRDRGRGFDPAAVDPARLGLRRSVTERTADCGGQAAIWSAPGQGTTVRLTWPAPAPPAPADQPGRVLASQPW